MFTVAVVTKASEMHHGKCSLPRAWSIRVILVISVHHFVHFVECFYYFLSICIPILGYFKDYSVTAAERHYGKCSLHTTQGINT